MALFGVSYGSFFVGSNGYVTFGAGDTDVTESIADHFSLPRIAVLFDDLDPASGGSISARQFGDRVAVTWENIPQFGLSDSNNFQIEMFFDGRIAITILSLGATDGLIGLSAGVGTPSGFIESNFNAFPSTSNPLSSWRSLHGLATVGSKDLQNPSGDGFSEFSDLNAPFAPNPAATAAAFGIDANWERVTVTDWVTSGGVRTARLRVRTSP